MKKKKILFASLLLLIIVVPLFVVFGNISLDSTLFSTKRLSASAVVDTSYRYSNWGVSASNVYGSNLPYFCVNSGACHSSSSKFWMHEAIKYTNGHEDKYYHGYCLHIGKKADGYGRPNLTGYTYSENFDTNVITNNSGNSISAEQLSLLQDVLAAGYHFDTTFSTTIYRNTNSTIEKKIFVKQVIVWEIIEGGRTTLGTDSNPAPNVYTASNSAYNAVISNKSDLKQYYEQELKAAREYRDKRTSGATAPIFGKTYSMTWNRSLGKYTTGPISGLGGFGQCTPDNDDATVTTSTLSDTVTVVSSKPIQDVTVTCKYQIGNGSNSWTYYKFTGKSGWQDVINGIGGSSISKTFTVNSEQMPLTIEKQDPNGRQMYDVEFTLTYQADPTIKYTIKPGDPVVAGQENHSYAILEKSGDYLLEETVPPHGYEQISQTVLTINIQNKTISSSNTAQVQANYNSITGGFKVIVRDSVKAFEIRKTDESGQPLKGATFRIYNGNNFSNPVKFNKSNNSFTYSENGSVIDIYDSNNSTYAILMLKKGIYKVVETAAPSPYIMASSETDRTYYIKVADKYDVFDCGKDSSCSNPKLFSQNALRLKNYKSKVIINKIGNGGVPLQGVKFVLLNSNKNGYINSTGSYDYSGTTNSFENATVYVTNASGNIVINNLPVGTYYLKEIATIDPYVLPDGDDAYTQLVVEMKADGPRVNGKISLEESISNATKQFNFYKVDENGNYLSGGKFKIQKYNEDLAKFEDIKITSVPNDGTYQREADIFKEDPNGKVQFTLAHGIATFIEMKANTTYRVVELEAPKGYQVANVENGAIIKIDRNGYAKGSATIINQKRSLEGSTAQAELIIEIQTGQKVIKYGLIIGGTLIIIAGLMATLVYISKKRK